MDSNLLPSEFCRVGRSLFERGYMNATTGNISVRLTSEQGGGMLLYRTDASLGFLQADALACVDEAPSQCSGGPATAEAVAAAITRAASQGRPMRGVLLDLLGPIVRAGSPGAAMAKLEELGKTARLWIGCYPRPEPLHETRIDQQLRHSDALW